MRREDPVAHAALAHGTQKALQAIVLNYAHLAQRVTSRASLAVSGGVFLNILANSEIEQSAIFDRFYVPSAPHDAGIAVGCAFLGSRTLDPHAQRKRIEVVSDRVGLAYEDTRIRTAVLDKPRSVQIIGRISPSQTAALLRQGEIVGRFDGRSEFGPRALGGRSLLASPLLDTSKQRLNAIKGRQAWRPVAPIVIAERIHEFFDGPTKSSYMNFVHTVREEHREQLRALSHPDASTRVQTLDKAEDPTLYQLLVEFGLLTGFPVLVNTSMNGPGEPIVETPENALEFFLAHLDVDALLLQGMLTRRGSERFAEAVNLAPDTIVSFVYPQRIRRIFLVRRMSSLEICRETFDWIEDRRVRLSQSPGGQRDINDRVRRDIAQALAMGLLIAAEP